VVQLIQNPPPTFAPRIKRNVHRLKDCLSLRGISSDGSQFRDVPNLCFGPRLS